MDPVNGLRVEIESKKEVGELGKEVSSCPPRPMCPLLKFGFQLLTKAASFLAKPSLEGTNNPSGTSL